MHNDIDLPMAERSQEPEESTSKEKHQELQLPIGPIDLRQEQEETSQEAMADILSAQKLSEDRKVGVEVYAGHPLDNAVTNDLTTSVHAREQSLLSRRPQSLM